MLYSGYYGKIDAGMLSAVYPVRNLFLTGCRIIPLESFASNGTSKTQLLARRSKLKELFDSVLHKSMKNDSVLPH